MGLGKMRQPISLGVRGMEKLRRDPKCPNCGSKDIRLDKILNPENPLPQFREFPIYKCGECGYWTLLTDRWTWHPPKFALEGFPYEELMRGTEYGSRLNVDKVPCFQCNRFDPYQDGESWRPCDKRKYFCWKYGRSMCRRYSA